MKIDENNDSRSVNDTPDARKSESLRREREDEIRAEGLRKGIITTSIIAVLILVVAGILIFSHFNREQKELLSQMDTQIVTYTENVSARDSALSEWMTTFGEIERNIALIREKEQKITNNSTNTELSTDKRQRVLDDIKYINTLIDENKKKISYLNAQLKKSGGTMKIMETKIADLEASILQNENDITELKNSLVNQKFEVEQLNTKVALMQDTIVKNNEKIGNQIYDLNKAYYTSGTYKELRAKGLITREGGFIGIGKAKSLAANFSDSSFQQIDITATKSFSINSKSARLITEHPVNSYTFKLDNEKQFEYLEITNPAEFWKISKYAMVEIAK